MMTSKQLSANSEKYFVQKFTKELIKQWQSLTLDEHSAANETLGYEVYKEFLMKLGFIEGKMMASKAADYDET